MRRRNTLILFTVLMAILLFFGTKQAVHWIKDRDLSPYMHYPSVLPQLDHFVSIRFDPSYYYGRGQRPRELAKNLARKWHSAGITLVYYRAYDPQHGAFYQTKYPLNSMDDFGKYDLLRQVIRECHRRQIKVYAWLPVLNHAGAWEANPHWRVITSSGDDYRAEGLLYPLCARRKEVREWWIGFLDDLLKNYPEIDGIDFAEPVVSWKEEVACYCDECREAFKVSQNSQMALQIRAQPLTALLGDSIARVHSKGKKAGVTTVQSADKSGRLLTSAEFLKITGFDLDGLLQAEASRTPDLLCPEFIWQELKSREILKSAASAFTPQWTEDALRQFIARLKKPVKVIAHVEITDFPGVKVDMDALKTSLHAAIQGGASGVDIYSSNELDKKQAWAAISDLKGLSKKKKCLVLYDREGGKNDALQVGALLGHFNVEVSMEPLDNYSTGNGDPYDVIFYVGVLSQAELPYSFVEDVLHSSKTICWLGSNIDRVLLDADVSKELGIEYVGVEKNRFTDVHYKGESLVKKDPWITVINISDSRLCEVLATAGDGIKEVPYAVRSGRRLWYFADVPTSHAVEGGRFLIFADLLHDILSEPHDSPPLAMVRIEDIHPLTDPQSLRKIADFLHSQDVPFYLSVVPFYVFPEENTYVSLQEKPELVEAVRYSIRMGGCVVMHGITHQRFGETTSDYEFWDPLNDRPPEGENQEFVRKRMERGLREFWSAGIYPLIWETPHYAGSQNLYRLVGTLFSLSMERRQSMDKLGTDQYFPYFIVADGQGQMILPENLGYVPADDQDPEIILKPARKMKVVRDGIASFFFHPFVELNVLKTIVRTLKKESFQFTTVADLPINVRTSFGVVTNQSQKITVPSASLNGKEGRLIFPGIVQRLTNIEPFPAGSFVRDVQLQKGELYAVHFISSPTASSALKQSTSPAAEKGMEVFQSVPNIRGERCQVPRPLIIAPAKQLLHLEGETESMVALFDLVGVPVARQSVFAFSQVPPEINLLLLPATAAQSLSDRQIQIILEELKEGHIFLITSGITALADELGIERGEEQVTITSVKDNYFPEVQVHWHPPQKVLRFESPGNSSFIYEDRDTGIPLVISGTFGKGTYLFLQSLQGGETAYGEKYYPHLLSHIFRSFRFFPFTRKADFEIYFNPAEREDIAIETLVKDWRRSGVHTVYAAAWQVFPDWSYDYQHLIHLAHTNGMLVYAWLEFPFVHEKFWLEHKECREQNGFGRDAVIDWRKPMAMGSSECFQAVKEELKSLLEPYDWDGVVVNRLGWESTSGMDSPATYTPFHPTIRAEFERQHGFDPKDLFDTGSAYYWKTNPQAKSLFVKFRQLLAKRGLENLLKWLSDIGQAKHSDWEIIVTYDESRHHSGLSLPDILSLKKSFDFSLQFAPTADGKQWEGYSEPFDLIRLSISPSSSGQSFYADAPTSYPTGTAMYVFFRQLISSNQRFSLLSENSLFEVDKQLLPFLFASGCKTRLSKTHLHAEMPTSGEIYFADTQGGHMWIDGKLAGSFHNNSLTIPVGIHTIEPPHARNDFWLAQKAGARLVDFSADLVDTTVTSLGLEVTYWANRRSVLVINQEPLTISVDGALTQAPIEQGLRGWSIILPKGRHSVNIKTRTASDFLLTAVSLVLSNTILFISIVAIGSMIVTVAMTVTRRRSKKSRST